MVPVDLPLGRTFQDQHTGDSMVSMRHAVVGICMAAATTAMSVVGAGVATAAGAGSATASTGNGVLYSGCWDHNYTYTASVPVGATHWDLNLDVYGPDGIKVDSDYLYGSDAVPGSGSGSVTICGSELGGSYTLRGVLEWTDADYNDYATTVAPVVFVMRKPFTHTSLTPSTTNPRYGQRVTLSVSSKDERPNGYFANTWEKVQVQRYADGHWSNLSGGRLTTNDFGRASMRFRFASRGYVKLRAVTIATADYTRSLSATRSLH